MVSGRGQFFVPPPIERTADHVVTLSYVSFFCVRERGRFLPTSSPRLVLMIIFLYIYLAFVVSVFVPSPLLG